MDTNRTNHNRRAGTDRREKPNHSPKQPNQSRETIPSRTGKSHDHWRPHMAIRSHNRRQRQPANNRKLQRPNHYRRISEHQTTTRNSSMRPIRANRIRPRTIRNDHKSQPQNIKTNPASDRPMDQPTKTHTIHNHHRNRPTQTPTNATTPKQINPSAPSATPKPKASRNPKRLALVLSRTTPATT
jgi:hypothetical protein